MDTSRLNQFLGFVANVGVLVGLILLASELRQNSALMRAQISMERAVTSMQIMADVANGGALVPIDVKLHGTVPSFPKALDWSSTLTPEERRRYRYWMHARLVALNNDWFQCTAGLMPEEAFQYEVRDNMRPSLHRFHEIGISFNRSDFGFIAVMQELARLEGLPEISDGGSWQ